MDKTEIKNPIEIKDNSVERVAFDLMEKIESMETFANGGFISDEQKTRAYWLNLYSECLRIVKGRR